jgi:hypothetical protein
MFLDSHFDPQGQWVRTRRMREASNDKLELAIKLVPCEVGDAQRFGFINGEWWKLEGPAHDNHKPVASTETSSFTLVEAEDGSGWQRLVSLFPAAEGGK